MNLYGRIGYAYNSRGESLARLAFGYLRDRREFLAGRTARLRRGMRIGKWRRDRIKEIARESGIPVATLYRWRSRGQEAGRLHMPPDFPSFSEWVATAAFDADAGLVFDDVISTEPGDAPQVYDVTTSARSHTFFANGILTGNCPPYNADFDGDEMNLHVLQSEEARAEARVLMRVQEHILSPRFGGPVIGGIHDHITGSFLLTHKDSRFTREEVTFILTKIDVKDLPPPDVKKGGNEYWSGKALFSTILPKDLSLTFKSSIAPKGDIGLRELRDEDSLVVIKDGAVSYGTIDENAVGAFKGKILDKIARDYGADAAREFIDKATKLAIGAIMVRGFTTGIDDEDIPDEAKKQIADVLRGAVEKVEGLVDAYKRGELEQMPGRSLEETLEVEAMKVLGRARDQAGQIAGKHLGINNSAVIMARSGARGSMLNLSQMAGCIGQQAVRGERLSRGYWNRTLPHFRKGDLGAEAKGFVKSSYKSGLHPTEYFFHAMGGREGLVDTAVRTSRSGYMQRRLINALEDLKVKEDGTVRNTANTIIQFRFGEDGVDPSRSVQGRAVDIDDILQEVLGEEPSWKERLREQEMASYGLTEKDMYVELSEEEIEVEEEEPSTEE
jgi:DNA-directed RNA polymerase subunit A'